MSKCQMCKKEMLTAKGCLLSSLFCNGKKYQRIKVGEADDESFYEENERCGDCGALYGHYHHLGCDIERCPICGMQLISCDCKF